MGLLAVQQLATAAEHCDDGNAFDRCVVLLCYVEVLVTLANIDVDNVIILLDQRLDAGLMESVIESEAVKAPIGSEDEKHAFMVLCSSLQRLSDFLVSIRIDWVKLTESRRNSVLCERRLLRQQQSGTE